MYINHNGMASNVANSLTSHYGNLATSTQRLSSGLRVNSAADDAAGLAIRELMRADIAGLNQGIRNANDGISLLQTADGALGIIDEKLIRMKELAEQAATGTYDSTQRLMIESEYQAMASEITRIANATDFNGIKLLNGELEGAHDGSGLDATGKLKVHFGTGNDSAEDYYYIEIAEATSEAFGLGNNSKWEDVQNRGVNDFKSALTNAIKNADISADEKGKLLGQVDGAAEALGELLSNATDYKQAYQYIDKNDKSASPLMVQYLAAASGQVTDEKITQQYLKDNNIQPTIEDAKAQDTAKWNAAQAAANLNTASDEDAYAEYLVLNGITGIDDAKADTANWTTATTNAKNALASNLSDAEIYDTYWKNKVGAGNDTAAGAKANDTTTWNAAVTAANTAGADGTDDDVVFSYYLQQKGVAGVFEEGADKYAAAKADGNATTGWNAAKTAAGNALTPTDEQIYEAYIPVKAPNAVDIATAKTDNTANTGWADAMAAASLKTRPATDEEVFAQYIATEMQAAGFATWDPANSVKLNAAGGENGVGALDAAGWAAAEAKVQKAAEEAGDPEALETFWNGLRESEQQKLKYEFGQNAAKLIVNGEADGVGLDTSAIKFDDEEMLNAALGAMNDQVQSRDFAGYTIETQEDAQNALNAINDAIVAKDKTRAHIGALQNRLENTVSNLTVQSENLQAAESRISDVDVATEMTNFVRNQILTQSAVAMLSQANSMPQMAMQLIH